MPLAPLSVVYAGILAARSAWWERYARTPPLPTISIGNLTVGGNGKTPFTLFLAQRLRQRGLRVGIVSRGYGGQASRNPQLVSDGCALTRTAQEVGDEPVMMAKSFPGPVVVAKRRIDAIQLIAAQGLADVVVLDDGFQHLRLRRDFDLLVLNQSLGLGNGWLLPAGPLRESVEAVRRADALILIESYVAENSSFDFSAPDITGGKPVLQAKIEPSSLCYSELGNWHEKPLSLDRRRVVAVSGIADCAPFHTMITELGADLLDTLDYADHYDYCLGDWKKILAAAGQADMVITTEKDLAKLERFAPAGFPLYALRLKVTMEPHDESDLLNLIIERIKL
jgi:tetraacyldisaccharide 4'-kinase